MGKIYFRDDFYEAALNNFYVSLPSVGYGRENTEYFCDTIPVQLACIIRHGLMTNEFYKRNKCKFK